MLMKLLREVQANMRHHRMVERGERVVAAVSGGPDSVVLLHLLYRLKDELGIALHVAHLNHKFRGAEAEADAIFVSDLAASYRLPATMEEFDVPAYQKEGGLSAQVAAREVRYRFLERVAREQGAVRIALAHHADDQAETVLLHFLRGAGLTGLKGMLPVRDGIWIRPLLTVRRAQIERYCTEGKLAFRIDSSNEKPVYLRNRVRMELLPWLEKEYNPGLSDVLVRLGEICREEDAYLEAQALQAYDRAVQEKNGFADAVKFSLNELRRLPKAIMRRVLRIAWRNLTGSDADLAFTHLEAVTGMVGGVVTVVRVSLPGGVTAFRSYEVLVLRREHEDSAAPGYYLYPLRVPGITYIPELSLGVRATLKSRAEVPEPRFLPLREALLDFAKLPAQLFVRPRAAGDRFTPYGRQRPEKLKEFLIKQKIPRSDRDRLPLLGTPEEIIWVGGIRVGERWKIEESTKKVLHLEIINI